MEPQAMEPLEPEHIRTELEALESWGLLEHFNRETRRNEPVGFWTSFEMADHLEACELVLELGMLADVACAAPDVDVRDNRVLVTCGTRYRGVSIEDFDFAKAVDREIGVGPRRAADLEPGT